MSPRFACNRTSSLNALCVQVDQGLAASTILLTGGNANIPGFYERFVQEVRPFIPDMFEMKVYLPEHPESYAWQGAARFSRDSRHISSLRAGTVSRAAYLEFGHHYCNEKISSSW